MCIRKMQVKSAKKIIRHHQYAKILYYFIILTIVFVTFFLLHSGYEHDFNTRYAEAYNHAIYIIKKVQKIVLPQKRDNPDTKYILVWTPSHQLPYTDFTKGNSIFENKSCQWQNCYVTSDRNYLGAYTEFDVIFFYGPSLTEILYYYDVPRKRFMHQKYVFGSVESASYYPVCLDTWNEFFNWTWTYRLNSDSLWAYIVVRNAAGHVIGPRQEMHWISPLHMDDIDDELKTKLKSKSKAAAIFVSNCNTLSLREEFVKEIDRELRKYKLSVDVFGSCGKHQCPKEKMERCLQLLEKHYYFYFAFENSFDEDYVTEKILYALLHNTVPVVYGGANYSRFMPSGIYLDARQMGAKNLAKTMSVLIHNPAAYHSFFWWKKYYSYHYRHESPETDDYCRFCAMVNNEHLVNSTTIYDKLNKWWSGNNSACMPNSNTNALRKTQNVNTENWFFF